ncbi:hypothetical protein BGZ65_003726 [Modicella reniformis]|uniref:Thioredoxin domain-containing protein n=1 Tax=Modicella reniformis TaxID=1440133 RepID=A0A9P6ML88_9FUNG|nr:hypothetical protein BGZ65_003726 [Modicella reniformis]
MHFRSILSAAIAIAVCPSSLQGADSSMASKRLTASDFAAHIAEGATFVKFCSPECKHSLKLAPTWDQLAEEHKDWQRTKGFKFVEVDCLTQGDLCENNEVVSYPTLRLFYKGKLAAKYTKTRSIEALSEFVAAMAAEYINVPLNISAEEVGEVKINALGQVVTLDIESYARRTQFGPWVIEYYAPWCGHCKALTPTYEQLAADLKDKVNVAKVDCTQNEDICTKEGVRGYPTIKLHQHGQSIEYRNQRSLEAMSEFALGAIVPSVKPISLKDLDNINDVAFVYIHDTQTNPKITALIEKQSQIYYEHVSIHDSDDAELARHLSVSSPALVVLKNNRQYQYQGSLTDPVAVQAWIAKSMKPLVITLTNQNTGTVLGQPGWVILGLFDPSQPTTLAARRELIETAQKYHDTIEGRALLDDKPLQFAILDATKWENYVRGAFNLELSQLPVVLVINSRGETFYPFGLDGRRVPVDQEALLAYIADIESGLLLPKSMVSTAQKFVRQVQRRVQGLTKFAGQHPMIAMAVGIAFVLAMMRTIAGKRPEEEEEGKDIKQE